MNIGVIGYGVVGTATAEVLRRLGNVVAVHDTDPNKLQSARAAGHERLNQDTKPDVLFVCVPEDNLREALLSAETTPITVIRSTVPPGTTEALSRELGDELVFMPEFLREASALQDSLNPSFILIGCHSQDRGRAVAKLFAPLLAPVSLVPPSTAEMVKLAMNAYLYTLVSFWNEMHLICGLAGIPSPEIGKLCTQDPRVSTYGAVRHGRPVGGRCLPKDLAKLVAFAEERGFEPELLRAAQGVNESLEARANGAVEDGHDPLGLPHLEVDGRRGLRHHAMIL